MAWSGMRPAPTGQGREASVRVDRPSHTRQLRDNSPTCCRGVHHSYGCTQTSIHTLAAGTHASTSRTASAQAHRRPSGGARCLAMLAVCQQHDRWGCRQPPLAPGFNIESGSVQAAAASNACCLGSKRLAADGCLAVVLLWRARCWCRQAQCAARCFCTAPECALRTHVRCCILFC